MRERLSKLCQRRFCLKGSRVHLETDDLNFLVSRLFVRYDLVESTKQFHNGVDIVGQLRPSRNLISSIRRRTTEEPCVVNYVESSIGTLSRRSVAVRKREILVRTMMNVEVAW